jgi:putative ABC transport system permease protein
MSWPRVFAARLRGVFGRSRIERQMEDELRFHLEMQIQDNLRLGMSPEEARYNATRRFGGVESMKEEYRDRRGFAAFETLIRDVSYAVRALRKNPGFTGVAVMTLALGIGVNATVFTVTKAALFAGFPMVKDNDRVLYLSSGRGCCLSYPDFEDWRAQAKSFDGMAIVYGALRIVTDKSGFAESYYATEASADTFRIIGQRPFLGRDFNRSDDTPGAPPVAILAYDFWRRRFGKDPSVVGRTIRMDGAPTTVLGIMPQGFLFPQKQDLWVPLIPTPGVRRREARDKWFAFGRLAQGATIAGARAEMEIIGRRLGAAYPLTNQGRNLLPFVQTFNEFFFFGNENEVYWSMWGAVGFVLLIACANLANLMLASALGRSREISLRIALGAGRWRIVRQLLIESLLLSGLGATAGWWIAKWGVHAYELADRGPGMSSWRILDYSMDYRVLAYIVAISAGTALLFGLAPALRISRLDVNSMLKDGGRGATGGGSGKRLPGLLVVGEIALAVVLLAGAGVTIRSFLNIYNANLGVRKADMLAMSVNLPQTRYPRSESRLAFFDRVKANLEAIPEVESVALASRVPTGGSSSFPYELAGAAAADEKHRPILSALVIGPGYFRTMGTAMRSGREFNDFDVVSGLPAAIVNERFATRYWPGENPLGKRLRLFDGKKPGAWLTVVGLAPNIVQNGAVRQDPLAYLAYTQNPTGNMEVMARTRVPPGRLVSAFRRAVQGIDSDLPVLGPRTLDERLEVNYWSNGLYGVLFLILAAVALLLASVGLYAVIAHSVTGRTQEMGIRMAIGATSRDVRRLIVAEGMRPVAIGLVLGLAASLAVNRALKSLLVQVSPADPAALAAASAILILAALLGCLIPARRAMRVDPVIALRHD